MSEHTDIEVWDIDDLIPYSNNPKEHPDEQVQKIASSIKNYGWDQPIVVDGEGEIIKGHGRRQAAQTLGIAEVPVIVRDDLTDAEAKAARVADNKTAESAWDDELLSVELEQVADEFDAEELGFEDEELDELLGNEDVPEFGPVDEEEQPDLDETNTTECPECGHEFNPNDFSDGR